DISYGRLLFPGLVGFAPLLVYGWSRIVGRLAVMLILPLILIVLGFPISIIAVNYTHLDVVTAVPADAIPVNVSTGDLTVLAYQLKEKTVAPGKDVKFDLYFTGANPTNPALLLTITDPITLEALGNDTLYPGSAPTDSLQPGVIYRGSFQVGIQRSLPAPSPRQVKIQLGWQLAEDTEYLPLTDANGAQVNALLLDADTLIDSRYQPPELTSKTNASFGDAITLEQYQIRGAEALKPGDAVTVDTVWRTQKPLDGEWSLTVQLLDASGKLIQQADGAFIGYPTAAWRAKARTLETRTLTIPTDTPPGDYQVWVGWYKLDDPTLTRLPVTGEGAANDLYPLSAIVQILEK
ncbi:MAG TPA: hypothetical protein VHL11_16675, partial [Phototrophicaceae bacterium]|nr:hypothetical protein [Phototrophicaceae bacterium]